MWDLVLHKDHSKPPITPPQRRLDRFPLPPRKIYCVLRSPTLDKDSVSTSETRTTAALLIILQPHAKPLDALNESWEPCQAGC